MTLEFLRPTSMHVLADSATGDRLVAVSAFIEWARRERDFDGTEAELVRTMEVLGWRWERQTATNPDDSGEAVTMDLFRIPAGWEG